MISTTIKDGGVLNLSYTSAVNTIMNSGVTINMYTSAVIMSQTFDTGTINVYSGAKLDVITLTSNATMNIYGGGYTTSTDSSYVNVYGGILNIYSSPSFSIYVENQGIVYMSSQDGAGGFVVQSGGIVNVGAGSFLGTIIAGGTLNLSNLSYDGPIGSTYNSDMTHATIATNSGATINIGYGAYTDFHYYEGGVINIQSGGCTSDIIYTGYGDHNDRIYISSGGLLAGNSNLFNITLNILSGGSADTVTFMDSGSLTVDGSINSVILGVLTYDGRLMSGGSAIINSGGVVNSLIAYSNAKALFNAGASLTGNLTLNDGAKVTITTSTGGTIDLVGNTNTGLTIYGSAAAGQNVNVTTVINEFSGAESGNSDSITLSNINQNDITNVTFPDDNHITLTLSDNSSITLNIPNIKTIGYSLGTNDNNELTLQVCFLTGTMIEIPGGICAVEKLQIGDSVLVYDPTIQEKVTAPVTWIGHKKASIQPNLHNDEAGYPVRILKGAIAENIPNKDLLITAEHCLFFDGKLIPARMLVNGYSIYYDTTITNYDYFHIETKEHSILTADGILTESYLDTGNRHIFNQDYKIIELSGDKVKTWEKDAIASLTVERSIVEPIYNYLLQRVDTDKSPKQVQSFEITQDPNICLMTDNGDILYQHPSSTDKKVSFIIPNNVNAVWILSNASRPCDVIGSFIDDRRYLGVLIGDITLQRNDQKHHITTHTEADYLSGWDIKETIPCRWTTGKAFLPLNVKNHSNMTNLLTLDILSDHLYHVQNIKDQRKKQA